MGILELLTNCHMFCLSFMSSSLQVSLLFNPHFVSKCVSGTPVCERCRESSCQVFAIGFQGVWFQVRCLTLLILIMMCAIYKTCSLHHQWLPSFVAFMSSLCCSKDNYVAGLVGEGWWENLVGFNPLPADLSLQFKTAKWKMSLIIQQLGVAPELQQTCNTKPLWSLWACRNACKLQGAHTCGG